MEDSADIDPSVHGADAAFTADLDQALCARLGEALADQFATLTDARPVKPNVEIDRNVLSFSFRGGLTPADEWQLEHGHGAELRDFRLSFLGVARDQLGEVVEALSGCGVRGFFASFDPERRVTECLFVLDEHGPDRSEQRQALLNWSEQVRRNSREIRARHAESRRAHVRERELWKETRLTLED